MTGVARATTCSDEAALLRGILLDPANDLPRLVYADWLEEHDQGLRAQFIRLQCEPVEDADRYHQGNADCRCKSCLTVRREAKFWPHLAPWAAFKPFPAYSGREDRVSWRPVEVPNDPSGLLSEHHAIRAEFVRGFVAVATFWAVDRFLEYAPAVFAHQPVERVILRDCTHVGYDFDRRQYYFERQDRRRPAADLAELGYSYGLRCAPIPAKLRRFWPGAWPDPRVHYDTPEQAQAALWRACVAYGRKSAGLAGSRPRRHG